MTSVFGATVTACDVCTMSGMTEPQTRLSVQHLLANMVNEQAN